MVYGLWFMEKTYSINQSLIKQQQFAHFCLTIPQLTSHD